MYLKKTTKYLVIGNVFLVLVLLIFITYTNFYLPGSDDISISPNYLSVDYTRNISKELSDISSIQTNYFFNPEYKFDRESYNSALKNLNIYLKSQENNITERGEKAQTKALKVKYLAYINLFDSILKLNNRNYKLFFAVLFPAASELKDLNHTIYLTNYYALVSKNKNLMSSINKMIFCLFIFFELILIVILNRFSKATSKHSHHSKKEGETRDIEDYPKYFGK